MKFLKLTLIIFFAIQVEYTFGQNQCKDALYEANKQFESGNVKSCIETLEACLKYKKNKEEKIEIYHLLAQAYLIQNEKISSEKYITKLLKLKPDYQKFPNIDPIDFMNLINQFEVTPRLYAGIKAGFNINSINLKKSYSAYTTTQQYLPVTGYQIGGTFDYRLKKNLSLNADILYSGIGINHMLDNAGGWQQNYQEQQDYLGLNLSIERHLKLTKKVQIYGGAGINTSYLLNSNVFFESTNIETQSQQQATQNPLKMRNRIQTAALGQIGVGFPLFQGVVSLETNYCYFFGTTVNADKRMDDLNFTFNNQYVNDDVSLRLLMVNLSFKLPVVYNIKLKK